MKKVINALLYITIVLITAYVFSTPIRLMTSSSTYIPMTYYSSVENQFVSLPQDNSKEVQKAFEQKLPELYYRQLAMDGTMPDTLSGVAVSPQFFKHHNFFVHYRPSQHYSPNVPMYPLMEALSGEVNLRMPDDYFRLVSSGIEFVRIADNKVDQAKSEAFTSALSDAGFIFPACWATGIPNPKKTREEGYFLSDNEGKVFRIRMEKGNPVIYTHPNLSRLRPTSILPQTVDDASIFGLAFCDNNEIYAITAPDMEPKKLPLDFDPTWQSFFIWRTPFYWNISVDNPGYFSDYKPSDKNQAGRTIYAFSPYQLDKVHTKTFGIDKDNWDRVRQYLFPFVLQLKSQSSSYFSPSIRFTSWHYLYFNIPLALLMGLLGYYCLQKRPTQITRRGKQALVLSTLLVVLLGIYAIPAELYINGHQYQK